MIENGLRRIKIKKMIKNIAGVCAQSSICVTTCNSIVFRRFGEDSCKRIKTRGGVDVNNVDRCVSDNNANANFKNALVSTRPKAKLIAVKSRLKPFQNCSRYRNLF